MADPWKFLAVMFFTPFGWVGMYVVYRIAVGIIRAVKTKGE